MGLFGSKLVDQDTVDWQFEHFEDLIKNLSTGAGLPDSTLQLPVRESFIDPRNPNKVYKGHALAKFLLKTVQAQCGMSEITIKLTPTTESKPQKIGGSVILQTTDTNAAAGRYIFQQTADGEYKETITYDRDLLDDPAQLIATFAHELSHCLHNRMAEKIEFEEDIFYEMFTDLTAVYLGYGIFLANGRFQAQTDHDSWSTKSHGYLSEADLIFATALFMRIKNISQDTALPHLKPHLRKMMKKAMKQLDKHSTTLMYLQSLEPNARPNTRKGN